MSSIEAGLAELRIPQRILDASSYTPEWLGLNRTEFIRLDRNENTRLLPVAVQHALVRSIGRGRWAVQSYPESAPMQRSLADYTHVPPEYILCTNGSDQGIDLNLKLASSYAAVGDRCQDELAAEVQEILERIGGHDDEIADLLLGRAVTPEQGGQVGRAQGFYVECVRRLAGNLADAAVSYLAGDYESASFGEELQFASEKIRYCSDRVRELECGHD